MNEWGDRQPYPRWVGSLFVFCLCHRPLTSSPVFFLSSFDRVKPINRVPYGLRTAPVLIADCYTRSGHAQENQCQDKTRQNQTRQDQTRQDKTRQDETRRGKTRQNKTRQNKRQDKTSQDRTRQDETRQDNTNTTTGIPPKPLPPPALNPLSPQMLEPIGLHVNVQRVLIFASIGIGQRHKHATLTTSVGVGRDMIRHLNDDVRQHGLPFLRAKFVCYRPSGGTCTSPQPLLIKKKNTRKEAGGRRQEASPGRKR